MHRSLFRLATAVFLFGGGTAAAGLVPTIDNPRLSRLGLLAMLTAIPAWNASLLRRTKVVAREQLSDSWESGYRTCRAQFESAARRATGRDDAAGPRQHVISLDPSAERHDR